MGKLTLHAKIEIGLALALLLGSCGSDPYRSQFTPEEQDEISDIAADSVSDGDAYLDLEGRVTEIENRLNM